MSNIVLNTVCIALFLGGWHAQAVTQLDCASIKSNTLKQISNFEAQHREKILGLIRGAPKHSLDDVENWSIVSSLESNTLI